MNFAIETELPWAADGSDVVLTGPETPEQYCRNELAIVLGTFVGQYEYDQTAGTDWLTVLEKVPVAVLREHLRRAMAKAPSVASVDELLVIPQPERRVLIQFQVTPVNSAPITGELVA